MNMWGVVWWVLQAAGVVPATWFLIAFRPKRPFRPLSLVFLAFIGIAWMSYVKSISTILLRGGWPVFDSTADLVIRVGFTVAGDALLVAVLVLLLRYRRAWLEEQLEALQRRDIH